MYCSACGKKCPEGAKFCAYCGEKLPQLPPEEAQSAGWAPKPPSGDAAFEPPEAEAPEGETPEEARDEELEDPAPEGGPEEMEDPGSEEPEPADPEAEPGDPDSEEPDGLDPDEEEPDLSEPAPSAPAAANPMHRIFQRPAALFTRADDARSVRPLASNPAQPLRGEQVTLEAAAQEASDAAAPRRSDRRAKALARYDEEEWVRPGKAGAGREAAQAQPPEDEDDDWDDVPSAKSRPDRDGAKRSRFARGGLEEDERPARARGDWEDERPARARDIRQGARPRDGREDERPARPPRNPVADRLRSVRGDRGKAVTASGGMVTPPARRLPARGYGPARPSRRPKGKRDLFFEDLEVPAENFYDEAAEERALATRIKSIVALAILIGVVIVSVWLMWMPGGQVFRARWNLGAPATAYKTLGDQERAGGQIQRAADAYHNALKLDPENYDYALLVGQTYDMIGERENAIKAFIVCTQLKPAEAQPYEMLVDLYTVMGDSESAENWRAEGYRQTADESLAPTS